jgi:hypothetical protein
VDTAGISSSEEVDTGKMVVLNELPTISVWEDSPSALSAAVADWTPI